MWTAISLWVTHLLGIAVYAAFAWHAFAAGAPVLPWLAGLPLGYAALILAITSIEFLLAWTWRSPRLPAQRIGRIATARMVATEFITLLGSAARMMGYRWLTGDPSPAPSSLPVVLVHGVLCNAGVFAPMIRRLAKIDVGAVYALSYGPPLQPIERFVEQLDARIRSACAATGAAQVMIVGHSMGGLIARAYLRTHGGARVARVVTLGTPHHGSRFAWLAAGACLAQIRPQSAWLAALPGAPAAPPIVSLWSTHDSMVAPQTSCVLAGATNVAFRGIGHNALLRDDAIFARVVEEIDAARASVASN
ncbi:MAG: alpha/beta fold hydrolase [Casimicrobiaceae bacterium]